EAPGAVATRFSLFLLPRAPRIKGWHAWGRAACMSRLLEGVGETQQGGLTPGASGKGHAEGVVGRVLVAHPRDKAGRDLDAWVTSLGSDCGTRGGRKQNRVELVAVHISVEPEFPRGAQIHLSRRNIFQFAEVASGGLSSEEEVLAEAQCAIGIGLIEGNDIGKAPHFG